MGRKEVVMQISSSSFLRAGLLGLLVVLIGLSLSASAEDTAKSIHAIVGAPGGSSQIEKEVIEECIMQIPSLGELRPVADSTSRFLKNINGKVDDNRSVRTYSAVVEVPYVIRQKTLVVVTTPSIERSEPAFREVTGRFDRTIRFASNSENGDMFAGRDLVKEYFFSTEQKAADDAMRRARAWTEQKQSILCEP
jgi:hypothetical protein